MLNNRKSNWRIWGEYEIKTIFEPDYTCEGYLDDYSGTYYENSEYSELNIEGIYSTCIDNKWNDGEPYEVHEYIEKPKERERNKKGNNWRPDLFDEYKMEPGTWVPEHESHMIDRVTGEIKSTIVVPGHYVGEAPWDCNIRELKNSINEAKK